MKLWRWTAGRQVSAMIDEWLAEIDECPLPDFDNVVDLHMRRLRNERQSQGRPGQEGQPQEWSREEGALSDGSNSAGRRPPFAAPGPEGHAE
jgi:hypothetical protein